eukprot:jgi/Orpsp1_1/1183188/evm.model.c7180000084214.1
MKSLTQKLIGSLFATSSLAIPLMKRANSSPRERFIEHYKAMCNGGNWDTQYFSKDKVPYHSIETLMVEAPDYGHESVSETYSFWIWLEAVNGKITGDYSSVSKAWDYLEKHIIPSSTNQPGNDKYNPSSPATYAPESDDIQNYPAKLIFENGIVGQDPIAQELQQAYGTWDIYGMHWIIDADNWYGYGNQGDGTSTPSYINTFQRGPSESTWKTVPHPSWEAMKWGGSNGFLDLFTLDNSYSKQWRYTNAPDADARAVQAAYFAYLWAEEDGQGSAVASVVTRASKLGDYLRYAQYDKYFKKIGDCVDYKQCQAGSGKNSAHYLLSWYYSWGGGLQGDWSWRISCSHSHTGYQSPLAAWILSSVDAFKPKSATGAEDWALSMTRQLEFIRWLQTPEGCIAGGVTNSWQGAYAAPTSKGKFYGMAYDWQPVYHDPPSNDWTGMQGWGVERTCSLYFVSGGNKEAGTICGDWVKWAKSTIKVSNGEIVHATKFSWAGEPEDWESSNFDSHSNPNLHGTVADQGLDLGVVASFAKALLWYGMGAKDDESISLAQNIMSALESYKDELGYAVEETREDYKNFGG